MSHALSVLDRAIRGDPDGLSFLERTTSIYVLDAATTPGRPNTYGWWNFLNDALNDAERRESEEQERELSSRHNDNHHHRHHHHNHHHHNHPSTMSNLDAHVRLLATVTRRVARRTPSSDRRLIGTCLANASTSRMDLLSSGDVARGLLEYNDELRGRNMGRIAAIVFDFSYHRRRRSQGGGGRIGGGIYDDDDDCRPRSAFSDPVAMEQLCGALAANAVSSGPAAVRHLVSDWIVPSIDTLPSVAVVTVLSYIAVEAMEEDCPVGTMELLHSLVPSVFERALGPILIDSLRESDERGDDAMVETGGGGGGGGGYASGGGNDEHRTVASFAMRSLDSWCKANSIGAVKLRSIFSRTNVNILGAISDALCSNAKIMLDAVSDLVETLLRHDATDAKVSLGMSIVESVMSSSVPAGMAKQLLVAQQVTGENEKLRIFVLSELVSAVGLQRYRFVERQANGDTAVCRCLARTAANVLLESEGLIQNGTLQPSLDGLLDLLFKAALHPSIYVCGIAVEALAVVARSNSELSTRLLPHLQGKAIIPFHLIEDVDGSLEEYINFRNRVLEDALISCYMGCSTFYMESCGSAIEEFCHASPSPHLPYQLEAALFCILAVSDRATKRPINPSSNSIASGWIDQNRRSKMREVWNDILASLVEGHRPGEETTLWIQRQVIGATSI